MKSIRNIARTTAAALFVALGGWSCTTEEQIAVDPMPEGMETIDLSITVPPGAPENTATRALSADGEKTVAEVDVLQFTGDKFAHRAIGYGIEVTGDKTRSFTAKLLTGTSDLVLIVGGRAQVNDAMNGTNGVEKITAATTLQEALDRLKIEVTATNKITTDVLPTLPMFGFKQGVSVQAGNTIAAQLVRSVAKVTLSRAAAVTDAIFKFADVRLYNQALEGWIAPKFSSWPADNVATAPWFGTATAPEKASYTAAPSDAPILYTGSADKVTNAVTDYSIYTFEAPAGSEAGKESNVCLVVGGYYDGSTAPSYYRVDFRDLTSGNYLPLLRNHVYNVLVRSVTGPGYPNPDDAFHGTPRLVAEIVDWNAVNEHTIFDGQYFLEVDRDSIGLNGSGDAQTFTAKTNYDLDIIDQGFPAGLWLTKSSGATWLTVVGGDDGDPSREFTLTAARNTTRRERRAELDLTAGNLTKTIVVTQEPFVQVAHYLTVSPTRATFAAYPPYATGVLANPDDESTTITVSSDGEWTAKPSFYAYNNSNFELIAGSGVTITGTGYDTVISGTGDAEIVVKMLGNNTSTYRRNRIHLSFTATDAKNVTRKTADIYQEAGLPAGVLAAPGVIGYIWNPGGERHRELTINGSKEYNQSSFLTGGAGSNSLATGEPVEPYTVYIAQFKYGSLVALHGQKDGYFASSAILDWPREWKEGPEALDSLFDGKAEGAESWALVPTIPSGVLAERQNLRTYTSTLPNGGADEALGDPCEYYGRQGLWDTDWRLPSRSFSDYWDEFGTVSFGNTTMVQKIQDFKGTALGAYTVSPTDLPNGFVGGTGVANVKDWAMFLPVINPRSYTTGYKEDNSSGGDNRYWSSTSQGGGSGNSLYFWFNNLNTNKPNPGVFNLGRPVNYNTGLAIRCSRQPAATMLDVPDELVFEWTNPADQINYLLAIPVVSDGAWGYTFDIDPDLPAGTLRDPIVAPGNQRNGYDGQVSVVLARTSGTSASINNGTTDREIGTVTIFSIEDPTLFKTVRVHQTPEP